MSDPAPSAPSRASSSAGAAAIVVLVCDPEQAGALLAALDPATPLASGEFTVTVCDGGDDTVARIAALDPDVLLTTASLEAGDARSLIEVTRASSVPGTVRVVLIGDASGPVRNALDAADFGLDRFVGAPVIGKALRFAVSSAVDAARQARASVPAITAAVTTTPAPDSFAEIKIGRVSTMDVPPLPPSLRPRSGVLTKPMFTSSPDASTRAGTEDEWSAPATREPTQVLSHGSGSLEITITGAEAPAASSSSSGTSPGLTSSAPNIDELALSVRLDDEKWASVSSVRAVQDAVDSESGAKPHTVRFDMRDADENAERGQRAIKRAHRVDEGDELADYEGSSPEEVSLADVPLAPHDLDEAPPSGGAFARALREKMSLMARRLFADAGGGAVVPSDLAPQHDHQTEFDLASLADGVASSSGPNLRGADAPELTVRSPSGRDEFAASGGTASGAGAPAVMRTKVTDPGVAAAPAASATASGSGSGDIHRGTHDAPMVIARMFAQGFTGQLEFRAGDQIKSIAFERGRPVFAASNVLHDRLGQLLLREGKLSATQLAHGLSTAGTEGRRIGEVLVDLGYLKRRELLPAVRRQLEDIIYSLFGWISGEVRQLANDDASVERIRLSRHPAAIVLEGVRRKIAGSSLIDLLGSSTVLVEVIDRDRLAALVGAADLTAAERNVFGALDGSRDLDTVAEFTNLQLDQVAQLAWGLVVLGIARVRKASADEPVDADGALVSEADLVIDRERVRTRHRMVDEADYFALLGVRRDASSFEVQRAFEAARRDFSPESFPPELRRELARELDEIGRSLDEAYWILRDDQLRARYAANLLD